MKAGITIREKLPQYPVGSPCPPPLLWVSIGDKAVGYFAGEAAFNPAGSLIQRRHEMARVLRQLATLFEGNE
jgi:hypothetical protein